MLDRTCLAPHALARWAAETPDAVALEHVDGSRLTYAQLHADALRGAAALTALGVQPGDHVATMLPNRFDAHRALLALAWLRAVEVPLNTALTGRILEYSLELADVTTVVVAREFADRFDGSSTASCESSSSTTPTCGTATNLRPTSPVPSTATSTR